jgi:hypothetical protein
MTEPVFDALLKRMGEIASAVNAFSSEAVQGQAFIALIRAFHNNVSAATLPSHDEVLGSEVSSAENEHHESRSSIDERESKTRRSKRRDSAAPSKIELIKDLDLRPKGKMSFADFVAKKQPQSNEDKYAVVVYYLEQILGLSAVSESHIATVFRMTQGWREPENLSAGLRMAASRKATIDTSERTAIKTTPHGRNFVEHDLPANSNKIAG